MWKTGVEGKVQKVAADFLETQKGQESRQVDTMDSLLVAQRQVFCRVHQEATANFISTVCPCVCQELLPEDNGLSHPLTFQILSECQSLAINQILHMVKGLNGQEQCSDPTLNGTVCPFGYLAYIYNLIHIFKFRKTI